MLVEKVKSKEIGVIICENCNSFIKVTPECSADRIPVVRHAKCPECRHTLTWTPKNKAIEALERKH